MGKSVNMVLCEGNSCSFVVLQPQTSKRLEELADDISASRRRRQLCLKDQAATSRLLVY